MPVQNPDPLTVSEQRILGLIATRPAITIAQVADRFMLNRRTVERNLKSLQAQGRLARVGATKSGYWQVI